MIALYDLERVSGVAVSLHGYLECLPKFSHHRGSPPEGQEGDVNGCHNNMATTFVIVIIFN
jgi:hypothetical protein